MSPWAFPKDQKVDFSHFLKYQRFMPDMKVKYVYYYDTCDYHNILKQMNPGLSMTAMVKKIADSYKVDPDIFLTPAEIKKQIDLSDEGNHLVRLLQVGNKKTWVRMFNDFERYPSENEITAALKRLEVTPPKVAFLTGQHERSITSDGDKDFKTPAVGKTYRQSLINQGLNVETISVSDNDIPADVSALVITDPRQPFTPAEKARIDAFVDRGGNMLIAGEPDKQDVLNPVITRLGIQYTTGRIIQINPDAAPDYVLTNLPKAAGDISKDFMDIVKHHNQSANVTMPGAMGITTTGNTSFKIVPLLTVKDSANCWNTQREIIADSVMKFNPAKGDTRGNFNIAMALGRKVGGKEQRIIVVGDADFMSNGELARRNGSNYERINRYFNRAIIAWLGNNEFPVDISRPEKKDNAFIISSKGIAMMKPIFLGVIPALIIIWGALLLIIRKRK